MDGLLVLNERFIPSSGKCLDIPPGSLPGF